MPNVLVVDDDTLMRWSLRQRLERAGYTVVEAGTASDAVERFREGVDLVLLDYYLPDATGADVARELIDIDRGTPVIFMSAQASIERAVDSMKTGAYHYLPKMVGFDEILRFV